MNEVDVNAKIVWDYMLMHHELRPADAIFVLGSNDTRVAERAADVYLAGYAPYVIFSGGFGKAVEFDKPEAEVYAAVAQMRGVPADKIIKEDKATNTGENVTFTRELLGKLNLHPQSLILVQKPYMERRTYATVRKQWPEVDVIVTSPQIPYEKYADPTYFADKDRFINVMVGDLQRIKEYPARGFQIPQDIPAEVWDANEKLVRLGYTKYVL